MISNPQPGQPVQVWYAKRYASSMPLHGKIGVVVFRAAGRKMKNHCIEIEGRWYSIPAGNLRKPNICSYEEAQ